MYNLFTLGRVHDVLADSADQDMAVLIPRGQGSVANKTSVEAALPLDLNKDMGHGTSRGGDRFHLDLARLVSKCTVSETRLLGIVSQGVKVIRVLSHLDDFFNRFTDHVLRGEFGEAKERFVGVDDKEWRFSLREDSVECRVSHEERTMTGIIEIHRGMILTLALW